MNCSSRNDGGTITAAQTCSEAQLVAYDIWEVFCNENSGLTTSGADADGSAGLQDMEVALLAVNSTRADPGDIAITSTEYVIAIEWVSSFADAKNTVVNAMTVNICGVDRLVDPKLDVYCLRFK